MKYSEIKDLALDELVKRQKLARQELFDMKMMHAMGQLGNPASVRAQRRNIARIKTAINSKSGIDKR